MSGSADFFKELQRSIPKLERELAKKVVAVEAENFHAQNFRQGGFTDRVFEPWKPRKGDKDPGRAILVKSGAMKGHALRGRTGGNSVKFLFPLPYMRAHNEGEGKQPKRQFVGKSQLLIKRINRKAAQLINDHLNGL